MAAGKTPISRRAKQALFLFIIFELALAAAVIHDAWPEPEPAPDRPTITLLADDERVDPSLVQESITISVSEPASVRISGQDGTFIALGASPATWDSTAVQNGPYRIEAVTESGPVSLAIGVQNVRSDLETTAAVVGTATAVAAGGSAIGSSLAARAGLVAAQIGKESLIAVGEDQMRLRRGGKAKKHMASKLAFGLTLILVLLFFTFEALDAYVVRDYLRALPVAGGVAMVFVAGALGLEFALGFASRVRTGFRFLGSGAVSLAISSVAFRTPFGIPGYVEEVGSEGAGGIAAGETSDDEAVHVEGIRALASLTALLSLLMPFLWVGYRGNYGIVEVGMEIALVALATSALPIKPLPGYEIWRWRKSVSIPYATIAFLLYFGFQLAFLPVGILIPLGVAGAMLYTAVWFWLRARSADVAPGWYRWALARHAAWRQWSAGLMPRSFSALSKGTSKAIDGAAVALQRAAASVVRPIVWLLAVRRERRALREMRRGNAELAGALADVLGTFEGLEEDAMFTVLGDHGPVTARVGDFRDDAIVKVLRARYQDLPPTITVVDPTTGMLRVIQIES